MKRYANPNRTVTRDFKESELLRKLDKCNNPLEVVELLCFILANAGYDALVHEVEEGIATKRWVGERNE